MKKERHPFIDLIISFVVFVFFILVVVAFFVIPTHGGSSIRKNVAEGLMSAQRYKNLVVDNAINGFPFAQGASKFTPTVNTQSITVDNATGVIRIAGTKKSAGIVLTLIPTSNEGVPLVVGVVPSGQIAWTCKALDLSQQSRQHLPTECR